MFHSLLVEAHSSQNTQNTSLHKKELKICFGVPFSNTIFANYNKKVIVRIRMIVILPYIRTRGTSLTSGNITIQKRDYYELRNTIGHRPTYQ